MRHWMFLAALAAVPATAQIMPAPSREDPRLHEVRFAAGEPIRVLTPPGNDMTVMLEPGERIDDISIGNHAAYQITISDARDSFLLHTSMVIFQNAPPPEVTVSIATDQRRYEFLLNSAPGNPPVHVLRFTYDRSRKNNSGKVSAPPEQYKLSGKRELRPTSIRSDGRKTFIQWAPDQSIPAVFGLDRLGREEMVDGYMRGGIFTIDRVHDRLVFRIDDSKAEAARSGQGVRR